MKRSIQILLIVFATTFHGRAALQEVSIINFAFEPANANIQVGDTVRWTQVDSTPHTTTSGQPDNPNGLWDSGLLQRNATFSHTFNTPGTFPYFCQPHHFMTGTINVSAASNAPPSVTLTSPTNGAAFTFPASVTITANATDPDGSIAQVEFFDGTNSLGVVTSAPYSVTRNLAIGSHSLTAVARDNLGATNRSAAVLISVGSAPIANPIAERIPKGDITVELQTVATGFASPLGMVEPNDGSGRLFVYEQGGKVWVIRNGARLPAPLLDLASRLVVLGAYDERGLLGLAVHPQFSQKPLIYTYTSEPRSGPADFSTVLGAGVTNNHQSVLAEWRLDPANSNQVQLSSRRELMRIDQPQSNHNGGGLHFGPDSLLYLALGDGGAADDQGEGHSERGNGQDTNNIYGSVIRIDPAGTNSANGRYGVPTDNPFVGRPGVDEIFAYGFRNPYSYSFDRQTGALYLGDVGQNKVEEIDVVTRGGNYGWNVKEGSFFFDPNGAGAGYITDTPVGPVPPGLIDPIAQYDHDDGLAVVGGYVYRGSRIPALSGRYVFGDWGTFSTPSGRLYYLDATNGVKELRLGLNDRPFGYWLKGFAQDSIGEIYLLASRTLGPGGESGRLFKIVPAPEPIALTKIQTAGTNLLAQWTGGAGPFALQRKLQLEDNFWVDRQFTTVTNTTVPAVTNLDTAFFRVADAAQSGALPFTAFLSGQMERPTPVTNSATGSGTFSLEDNTLTFNVRYSGLSAPATAAHIHGPGTAAQTASVIIDLAPYNGGSYGTNGTVSGVILLSDQQKAYLLGGQTYVNFHNTNNPGGELRGQIAPVLFQAELDGRNERPAAVTNAARGRALLMLSGSDLTFHITYTGLSTAATAAHFHAPGTESQAAGVIINLSPYNGGGYSTSGIVSGTVALTPSQLASVIDGLSYINFHTVGNPGGEIRGQVFPKTTAKPFTAALSGFAERPNPVTNNASGLALFSLEGRTIHFAIRYAGLSAPATAAHFHAPATAAQAAGVIINLAPYNGGSYGTSGWVSGSVVLTSSQVQQFEDGLAYVNFHTVNNPGGEIRGQIAPVLFQTGLAGASERPIAVATPGTGSGTFTLVGDRLRFNVTYRNLPEPATAAHIHGPGSAFQSVGVLLDLAPFNGGTFGPSGSFAGSTILAPNHLAALVDGLTYLNIHTITNAGGEIRGQLTH